MAAKILFRTINSLILTFLHISDIQIFLQLLISDTVINRYQYMCLWNYHLLANLYCDVLLDAEMMKNVKNSRFSN